MYILSLPNHTHEKLGKGPFCTSDLRVIFTHQPRRPLRLKMAMFAARPNAISGVQQDRAEFGNSNHASTKIIQTLVICKWKSVIESFPFLTYHELCSFFTSYKRWRVKDYHIKTLFLIVKHSILIYFGHLQNVVKWLLFRLNIIMHQRAMIGHGCRKIRAKMPSNNTSFQFGHLIKIIWAESLFIQTQYSQRIRPNES